MAAMHTHGAGTGITRAFVRFRRMAPSRGRLILASSVAIVAAIILGLWLHTAIKRSLRRVLADNLQTILVANVTSLELWIENELAFTRSWARSPDVVQQTAALIDVVRTSPGDRRAALTASPSFGPLRDLLTNAVEDNDHLGFVVVDRNGTILICDDPASVGDTVATGALPFITRAMGGESLMTPPFHDSAQAESIGTRSDALLMATITPIKGANGRPIAALAFAIDPEKDFTRILSVAQMGETGHTYAFDDDGRLLSDCRFEQQLKEIGLLPNGPNATSALTIQIRNPGGDIPAGFRPTGPVSARPLTKMAASAIEDGKGIDLDGYPDFRGVKVVGAWQWLPKYNLGIATEVGESEAFAALGVVRVAFGGLGFLAAAAGGVILLKTWVNAHLRQTIDDVRQLGQYTLTEKIGQGGMGEVYKARHAMLRRPTAVKLLRGPNVTEESVARFEREVQLTSELTHPNTIEIYDYGRTPEGVFYYAMEYLDGLTLGQLIARHSPLPIGRVMHLLRQMCGSLREAHNIGLIHRDIKPANVFLCNRGGYHDVAKVLDFGLVKDISEGKDTQLTQPGLVAGTPAYMGPERLQGKEADARSDIFAIGALAYAMVSGREAFDGPTAMSICQQVMTAEPTTLNDMFNVSDFGNRCA